MLPLAQTHLTAVPRAPGFDNVNALASHEASTSHNRVSLNPNATFRRALPDRTAQPYQRITASANAAYSTPTDHHLRRKTPNGTIDAGYDASPINYTPAGPPYKQIVVPAQRPSLPDDYIPRKSVFSLGQHRTWIDRHEPSDQTIFINTSLSCQPAPFSPPRNSHYLYGSDTHDTTNQCFNIYQPLMRANEYNVRAFCPPPPQISDPFLLNPLEEHQDRATVKYRNLPPYPAPGGAPCLQPRRAQFNETVGERSFQNRPEDDSSQEIKASMARDPFINIEASATTSDAPTQSASLLSHDKLSGLAEKALARAHGSYIDLLAHLQSSRVHLGAKDGRGSHSLSRMVVYPKPPESAENLGQRIALNQANAPFHGNSHGRIIPPARVSSSVGSASSRGQSVDRLRQEISPHSGNLHKGLSSTFLSQGPYASIAEANGGGHHNKDRRQISHVLSPVENAIVSLDVLSKLCEQSGWKWIEGILLGGCLHYGLGNYQDAVKWFATVTSLDPGHVEAMTDMAATLYCLDRSNEAEELWLKAVKLRPDRLEATEHLVGLLYRKRSRDAIQIISFVQHALQLPRSSRSQDSAGILDALDFPDSMMRADELSHCQAYLPKPPEPFQANTFENAEGFGSSGYALRGKDNGRILALIHAKGTMLYSLKEVGQAAQAFEEAVLISVGRQVADIRSLVRRIQAVLTPRKHQHERVVRPATTAQPLLLTPERARQTAQMVFPQGGELPGLQFVATGIPKRAATQTTSNSLLSLAKIFQDSTSSGGAAPAPTHQPAGIGDILALYYLSLSLQESPSTANNVGILLAGVQQTLPLPTKTSIVSAVAPNIPGITPGSGLALAFAYYQYGLKLDPKHVHLHTNLGSLLKDIGQLDLAIQMYEQAVSCDERFDIALTNLANAVKDRGRVNDAIRYYRRAVDSNPGFAEAVCGLFTALNSVCDWHGRGGVFLECGKFDRWHVDENGTLVDSRARREGRGLTQRVVDIVTQQLHEASLWGVNTLSEGLVASLNAELQELCSDKTFDLGSHLRKWTRNSWEGSKIVRLVERATRILLRRQYLKLTRNQKQTVSPRRPLFPATLSVPPAPTVLPFHTFTCPLGAREIRTISQQNAIRISCSTLRSPWLPVSIYRPPRPPNAHLNVGYVSSDFNNHPLAHLMQSVFGFHDPQKVRAFCYATTASDKSIHRQQIEREAPVFRDVSSWPPHKLVQQIVEDEIHILVNLNGYTRGARNEIFAARAAPIQMSFMGFAGSLGAEWCDYILADTTAVPPNTLRPWRQNVSMEDLFRDEMDCQNAQWLYSENVIFCRDTFFCCDHAQSCEAAERQMTWEMEQDRRWNMRKEIFPQLSDDTIILGNFNQLYKIEPTTFRTWLRVLAKVPQAILWLLRFPEPGERNLKATARLWAGEDVASRIFFTDVASKNQHISRARVCDLFLDTPECNAHTTAADVLWSSTPLLTLPRYSYKMCSRMAASILKGAMPKSAEGRRMVQELIAGSEDEYEQSAIKLAGSLHYRVDDAGRRIGYGRLAEMRKVLWDSKWSCALFDTRRWVTDVEKAYEECWRRWVAGEGGDIYL